MALKLLALMIIVCLALDTSGTTAKNSLTICPAMRDASGYLPPALSDDSILPDQPYSKIVDRLDSTALASFITSDDPVVKEIAKGLYFDTVDGILRFTATYEPLALAMDYPQNPQEQPVRCPAITLATGNGSCLNQALTVCSLAEAMHPAIKARIVFSFKSIGDGQYEGHSSVELELNGKVYEYNPAPCGWTKSYVFDVTRGWVAYS